LLLLLLLVLFLISWELRCWRERRGFDLDLGRIVGGERWWFEI